MNIPQSAIAPFEPLGVPALNHKPTLLELTQKILAAEQKRREEGRGLYVLVFPDNPIYKHLVNK